MNETLVIEKAKKEAKPKATKEPKTKEVKNIENSDEVKKKKESSKRPKVTDMTDHALKSLYHRNGCTLVAIKKHIALTFECDEKTIKRMSPKIRNHILENLENNKLLILSGSGLSGRFKLSVKPKELKSKNDNDETEDKEVKIKKITNKEIKNKVEKNKDIKKKVVKNKESTIKEKETKKKKDSEDKEKKKAEIAETDSAERLKRLKKSAKVKIDAKAGDTTSKKFPKTPKHKKSLGVVAVRRSIHTPKLKKSTAKHDVSKTKIRESKRNKKDQEKTK